MSEKIRVLHVRPEMYPEVVEIEPTLEELQKAVKGTIQTYYPFSDRAVIICDDEGKLNGSQWNRSIRDENGEISEVIAGPFLVAGLDQEDFASLSPEQIEKYEEMFHQPEVFLPLGNRIHVFSLSDEYVKRSESPTLAKQEKQKGNRDLER